MEKVDRLYVSVHIPKTGGSSFRQVLEQQFGDRLQLAYDPNDGWPIVPKPACIHGHGVFEHFADVIAAHANVRWMTFLREPLQSAISQYFFTKWHSDQTSGATFRDRGLEYWLTHAEPFRWPDPPGYNHNRYAKWFEPHPIEQYDFVGLTEHFDESLVLLYRLFQWEPLYYKRENVGGYDPPNLPEDVITRFRELNAGDYAIYAQAVERLESDKREYGPGLQGDLTDFRERLKLFRAGRQPATGP